MAKDGNGKRKKQSCNPYRLNIDIDWDEFDRDVEDIIRKRNERIREEIENMPARDLSALETPPSFERLPPDFLTKVMSQMTPLNELSGLLDGDKIAPLPPDASPFTDMFNATFARLKKSQKCNTNDQENPSDSDNDEPDQNELDM